MSTIGDVISLAATHGPHLSAKDATVNEAGLDYRVIMASDATGQRWVLRVPRRADVSEGMATETRILNLVAPVLAEDGVAVPDWQVGFPELIAYPALPGAPGLTLTNAGQPNWHMDPASPNYAGRLGRLLALRLPENPSALVRGGVEM
ncbi:phosphotransferase [Streptomyces violaceusniger]